MAVPTRATRPVVADIAIVPCTSVRGSGAAAVPAPAACATTKVLCGAMVPVRAVRCQVVPAEEAYWIDQPSRLTGASEEL